MSHKGFVSKVALLNENYTVPPELVKDFIQRYIHVWFSGEVTQETLKQNAYFIKSFAADAVNKRFHEFMTTHALKGWNTPIELDDFKILDDNIIVFTLKLPKSGENGKVMGYNTIGGKFKLELVTDNSKVQVVQNPFGFYIQSAKLELKGMLK